MKEETVAVSPLRNVWIIRILMKFINTPKPVGYRSQEVGYHVPVVNDSGALSDGVEDLKVVLDILVNLHDGGDVTTSVAVVRSRPHGDEVTILKPEFKSVHDKLMGTGN